MLWDTIKGQEEACCGQGDEDVGNEKPRTSDKHQGLCAGLQIDESNLEVMRMAMHWIQTTEER